MENANKLYLKWKRKKIQDIVAMFRYVQKVRLYLKPISVAMMAYTHLTTYKLRLFEVLNTEC